MSEVKRYGRIGDMVLATKGLLELYPAMTVYVRASDFDAIEQRNSELLKAVEQSIEWFETMSSGDGSGHADLARAIRRIAKLPAPV